ALERRGLLGPLAWHDGGHRRARNSPRLQRTMLGLFRSQGSRTFPPGHSASALAFAYAVGRHLPGVAVPIRLLAGGVAYSRVHTGVHYQGDVAFRSIVRAGTAVMVA